MVKAATGMDMGMVDEVTEERGNTKAVTPGANVVHTVPVVREVNGSVATGSMSTILVQMGVDMITITTSGRIGREVSVPRGCRSRLSAAWVEIDLNETIVKEGNIPAQM